MKRIKLLFLLILCIPASAQTQLGADIDGEATSDRSGYSVSLSSDGNRMAIGAVNNSGAGTWAGHVRIYEYSAGSWMQLGSDIDGEAADDFSGWSVSLSSSGDTVAIGARGYLGSDAGNVRIYVYSAGSWSQLGADIDGEAAGDNSGWSVSLSSDGTTIAIGAAYNDGNGTDAGHVRIYEYSAGSWTQLGADIDGEAASDFSGSSVSLSSDGTTVAIGARGNDGNGSNAGHVRIYEYSTGSWTQLGLDIDGDFSLDFSGYSVSLSSDGNRVAIGALAQQSGSPTAAGHVRVYEYSAGSWTQLGSDIVGEAFFDKSGYSVSLSSDGATVAIGAPYNDGNGTYSGHARIYEYSAGSWTQLGLDIDGEASYNESGYSVSLSSDGTIVAIGAPYNDGTANNAGHVRVYSICFDTIQQQPQSNTFYTVPGDAYFTVIHSDTTANYQWQEDTGTGWSNLSDQGVYSGTATDSLILTGITASLNGYEYRCLVDACSMDTTNLATLTVVDNIGIGEVLTDVVVSPNPTSGILNIVVTSLSEYEVFNIN
ncbi:MAG: FG-GAP repeat protein, partial [Schleiferiaceae bacterium]|nr:FG-GAP repeat protein [Schleiferiaceae bacterium]